MLSGDVSPRYGAARDEEEMMYKGTSVGRDGESGGGGIFAPHDRVSPEQVIEAVGWSSSNRSYQYFLLVVTCVTIASEAAEVALLSLILPHIQIEFELTNSQTDMVAVSIFAGQMVGCFFMGALADKIGRRPSSIIASAMVAVGGYASALAPDVTFLIACRFAVGLGVGAAFVPVDMLAEACPEKVRTTRTQVANLSFSVGVVAITLLGALTLDFGWRFLAFMTAIPPTVALVMAFYISESPTWLADVALPFAALLNGRTVEAKKVLDRISIDNTGCALPEGLEIVSERELKKNDGVTRVHSGGTGEGSIGGGGVGSNDFVGLLSGADKSGMDDDHAVDNVALSSSAMHNLAGNFTNIFRTACLWTLAFTQTFNFYGLMLNSPLVFRIKQYDPDGVEDTSQVVFDYMAILIVNSGDVVGNGSALMALAYKMNPRWVAGFCAAISVPLLFVPLVPRLQESRYGLVFMMLIGRIPAAPIGAMSWILNSVAYPTLFRATGHGWANAVARFGAVTASSMYSMPPELSIPIHALALALAVPSALCLPWGSLELTGTGGRRR